MAIILLYIGIALIVGGWLKLSFFAIKQINAQKEYDRLPQKWAEIKHGFIIKRWICRVLIILGMVAVVISMLI